MPTTTVPPFPNIPAIEFRHVPDFPGYAVSDDGRVWSCKKRHRGCPDTYYKDTWKELSYSIIKRGYFQAYLSHNKKSHGYLVHRIVLLAFIGPCPKGMEACHKDDIHTNNHLSNLRWDTSLNNAKDRHENNRYKIKLTKEEIFTIRNLCQENIPQSLIAKRFNIHQVTVSEIHLRKIWKHI